MEIDRTWRIPTGGDKIIEAFMAPFASVEDFERNLDASVVRAKNVVSKWKSLIALFDSQIATLIARGVPWNIVRWYENERDRVLEQAMKMDFGKENIPFFPVISLEYRTIFDLMAMIKTTEGKTGYSDGSYSIVDMEETVSSMYIFNVSDGTAPIGCKEKDAKKVLAKQNRFPLTAVETIALCVHTDVLSKINYLSALGSCLSGNVDKHLAISAEKDFAGRPKLTWGYVQNWPEDSSRGIPSRDCWPRLRNEDL